MTPYPKRFSALLRRRSLERRVTNTGKITRWSELEGADQRVEVLSRANEDNIRSGFEASLGTAGRLQTTANPIHGDEKILRAVSGRDPAISYVSLAAAIKGE